MKYHLLIIVLALVGLVACTPPTPPLIAVSPLSPLSPAPTPTALTAAQNTVLEKVRPFVAEKENVPADTLNPVKIEEVIWPDGSLGCPQPGEKYTDAVVPGWFVVVENADGQQYEVHLPDTLDNLILCEPKPGSADPRPTAEADVAIAAAQQWLAQNQNLPAAELTVQSAEARNWSNSCLGCAAADEMCATVITPGYRIVFLHGQSSYEVHTDAQGKVARLCSTP